LPHESIIVARAIALGIISEKEVATAIHEKLRESVALFAEAK